MKVYCDVTGEDGCFGLILGPGAEVVYTGCQLHAEPEKLREHPVAVRLAQECDFHFWFGKERPEKLLYTVPQTEIVGFDSRGGYFPPGRTAGWRAQLHYTTSAPTLSAIGSGRREKLLWSWA